MNKTYLIGALVLAFAAIALYAVLGPKSETQQPADTLGSMMKEERMQMKHTLRELMGMSSQTLSCTYVSEDAQVRTEGTTYIGNGKVRSDSIITTKADGKQTTASSIIDGNVLYAWGSAMSHGMKMNLSVVSDVKADAQKGSDTMGMDSQAAALDATYDYDCAEWTPDASFFAPPAGVTFMDYSEMMQGMQGMMQQTMPAQGGTDAGMMDGEMMMDHSGMGGGDAATQSGPPKEMLCAACEQAPDAASKAQCRATLQCQ
jgi:hypothetical protein